MKGSEGILNPNPDKVAQLLNRLVSILAEQSTRVWAWGIGISGKGDEVVLDLTVMDREVVRQARLMNCFSKDNVGKVAALLATFASATPAQLGYSPLLTYSPLFVPLQIDLSLLPSFEPVQGQGQGAPSSWFTQNLRYWH